MEIDDRRGVLEHPVGLGAVDQREPPQVEREPEIVEPVGALGEPLQAGVVGREPLRAHQLGEQAARRRHAEQLQGAAGAQILEPAVEVGETGAAPFDTGVREALGDVLRLGGGVGRQHRRLHLHRQGIEGLAAALGAGQRVGLLAEETAVDRRLQAIGAAIGLVVVVAAEADEVVAGRRFHDHVLRAEFALDRALAHQRDVLVKAGPLRAEDVAGAAEPDHPDLGAAELVAGGARSAAEGIDRLGGRGGIERRLRRGRTLEAQEPGRAPAREPDDRRPDLGGHGRLAGAHGERHRARRPFTAGRRRHPCRHGVGHDGVERVAHQRGFAPAGECAEGSVGGEDVAVAVDQEQGLGDPGEDVVEGAGDARGVARQQRGDRLGEPCRAGQTGGDAGEFRGRIAGLLGLLRPEQHHRRRCAGAGEIAGPGRCRRPLRRQDDEVERPVGQRLHRRFRCSGDHRHRRGGRAQPGFQVLPARRRGEKKEARGMPGHGATSSMLAGDCSASLNDRPQGSVNDAVRRVRGRAGRRGPG